MFKILSSSVGTAIAAITKELIKHSILDGIEKQHLKGLHQLPEHS